MVNSLMSSPQSPEERDMLNRTNGQVTIIDRPQHETSASGSTTPASTNLSSVAPSSRHLSLTTQTAAGQSAATFRFNPQAQDFIPDQKHFLQHPLSDSQCLSHAQSMAAPFPNLDKHHRAGNLYHFPVVAESSSLNSHGKRRPGHYRRDPTDVDTIGREYLLTKQMSEMPDERAWAASSTKASTPVSSRSRLDARVSGFKPGVNWYESERTRKATEALNQNQDSHPVVPQQADNSLSLGPSFHNTTSSQPGLSNGSLAGSSTTMLHETSMSNRNAHGN
ncbi:hypothetical protein F5Y18DRAFT_433688 [Xylariaceae sp. FL1019]|nr:hypothetical protein F5Y18DRAFT_433688 [Xylariaceae sp. FL1019]